MTLIQRRMLITAFVWVIAAVAGCYYAMAAPKCGERISAFTLWEDKVDGEFVEQHSIFTLPDLSPDSGFDGILIRSKENPNTILEVNTKSNHYSFNFFPWDRDDNYLVAKVSQSDLAGEYTPGKVVVKLMLDGKLICQDTRKIEAGD